MKYSLSEDSGIARSGLYRVFVGGEEIPAYAEADFHFVQIDCRDTVEVKVVVNGEVSSAVLRPVRRGKAVAVTGNELSFVVCRGDYLSLEIDGDITRPLLIFAEEAPERGAYAGCGVMYFPAGSYTYLGAMPVRDDLVLWIERGAVVEAEICGKGAKNLHILGGGILHYDRGSRQSPIEIFDMTDVEIRDITIIGKNDWCLRLWNVKNAVIEDVKILGDEVLSDGIDIVGGVNVLIRHVFIKNEDDSVCIKCSAGRAEDGSPFVGWDVRDVLVEDCVIWNGPRGNSLEIGYEINAAVIERVTFRNVAVIHRETQASKFHRSVISIHNAGSAVVRDILYENIHAESSDENFIQFDHMNEPQWGEGGGSIENVTVRNASLDGGSPAPSRVASRPGEPSSTRNIIFENLSVLGKKISSPEDAVAAGFTIGAENVKFY